MINKIEEIITNLSVCKYDCVSVFEWDEAVNWRDVERNLIRVCNGESLKIFLKQFKSSKYINYDEIYEVIKPLDVVFLRREKISKIEKLYK